VVEFNEENKAAMLRSEVMSWPLTLAVLLVAFGSLSAAGIPLLLSIAGLVATAGALWLGTRLTGITIWAMNFALMFALAVGIDYGLFVVVRFRAALRAGLRPLAAVGETMDSAGKAVLVSGLAVLASLSAVMVVPSQPFRTSALGIMLAVGFVLAASLTLLPAVLARLGPRIDRFALPWAGAVQHRSEAFARWGRLIWRRPVLLGTVAGLSLARARALRPAARGLRRGRATWRGARRGPRCRDALLPTSSDLDEPVRVENELLGRSLVEVLVALRRLVQADHGGVDRLGDLRLVVEDHLH
jgi:putative drug exporter of the RND superfamily